MYLNFLRRKLFLQQLISKKFSVNFDVDLIKYEIPTKVQNTFFLANSSFFDNINWYYHRGIEASFYRYVKKVQETSLSISTEKAAIKVLNKLSMLDKCSYILEFHFPLTRTSGRVKMIEGVCVKHGMHYPIHLGGLRISDDIEKSHLKALAFLASYKHACFDIPFAGGHTGIKINPTKYDEQEIRQLLSTFLHYLVEKKFIGTNVNIFEPELNCSSNIIDTITEEYFKLGSKNKYEEPSACATGKSLNLGGISNFEQSVAHGIFLGIENFLQNETIMTLLGLTKGWAGKTYLIKGLGKIATHLVEMLSKVDAKCVGICEVDANYYNKNGIDIHGAIAFKQKHNFLKHFFPPYNDKKIMTEKCDLLIIAATHKTLTCYTAPYINAKIVVEAASGAVTPTAHQILLDRKILVIPDIYINSGSSVASFIEYIKNREDQVDGFLRPSKKNLLFEKNIKFPFFGTEKKLSINFLPDLKYQETDDFIKSAIQVKFNESSKKIIDNLNIFDLGLDIRTAAYILATERIFEIMLKDR